MQRKMQRNIQRPTYHHIRKCKDQCSKKGVNSPEFFQNLITQLTTDEKYDNLEQINSLNINFPEIGTFNEFNNKSLVSAIMLCVLKKMYSDYNSTKDYQICVESREYISEKLPITVCRYSRGNKCFEMIKKVHDFERKNRIVYNALKRYRFETISREDFIDSFWHPYNGILYEPLVLRHFTMKNIPCPVCKKTNTYTHFDGSWKDFKCSNCNTCIEVKTSTTKKITESLNKNKFVGGACKYLEENFYQGWSSFILFIERDTCKLHLKKIFSYNPMIVKETLAFNGKGHLKAEAIFDKNFRWNVDPESKKLCEKMLPREELDILLILCKKHMKETDGKKSNDFSDIEEEFNKISYKFYKQRHRDNMCRVFEDLNIRYNDFYYVLK